MVTKIMEKTGFKTPLRLREYVPKSISNIADKR